MAVNEFTPAYYNVICEQQDGGLVCPYCSHTQIEHSIEPRKTCSDYRGPEVNNARI